MLHAIEAAVKLRMRDEDRLCRPAGARMVAVHLSRNTIELDTSLFYKLDTDAGLVLEVTK